MRHLSDLISPNYIKIISRSQYPGLARRGFPAFRVVDLFSFVCIDLTIWLIPPRCKKYSLFGGLLARDIDNIRSLIEDRIYEVGKTLISQNKANDSIFFILEGRVEVVKDGIVLIELGEGETVGEMELLDIMPAAATVRVLVRTTVGRISNRAVHEIFKTDQKSFAIMMMNLARDLSRRLRRMNEIAAPHFS